MIAQQVDDLDADELRAALTRELTARELVSDGLPPSTATSPSNTARLRGGAASSRYTTTRLQPAYVFWPVPACTSATVYAPLPAAV